MEVIELGVLTFMFCMRTEMLMTMYKPAREYDPFILLDTWLIYLLS